MPLSQKICVVSTGVFFIVGLGCGAWKYAQIRRSTEAKSSTYVDIAHRAALMYAFSCLVVERLVAISQLDPRIENTCVLTLIAYFAWAQGSYIVHAGLADTDNQFEEPHRLGKFVIPSQLMSTFMISLIFFELSASVTLLVGAINALN